MQTMLIAVQNTVPAKDMGVATSSATFFRQLGGTLGVAVFLSLLFNSLPDRIQTAFQSAAQNPDFQQAVRAAAADPTARATRWRRTSCRPRRATRRRAPDSNDALSSDSSFLSFLDPIIARPFQEGFVSSTQLVYIVGGIVMAVAFVLVLMMKELPLRTKSALEERMREQADEDAASRCGAGQVPDASSSTGRRLDAGRRPRGGRHGGAHALGGSGGSACRRRRHDATVCEAGAEHAPRGRHAPTRPTSEDDPPPTRRGLISASGPADQRCQGAIARSRPVVDCGHRPSVDEHIALARDRQARSTRTAPTSRRTCSVVRAQPDRGPQRLPATASSAVGAAGRTQQPAHQRMGAERAVPNADAVLGGQCGRHHRRLLAVRR